MVLPPAPGPGHMIGIIAPASPFDADRFEAGLDVIKGLGFEVFVAEAVRERKGYLAGADRQRAQLINELFANPEVRAIWCARGGYGSMRCLPFIDYAGIRANPKLLIGASDATALLMGVYIRCRMPVVHGPMVVSLADADEATCRSARRLFESDEALEIAADPPTVICGGLARGPVAGGNLTTLAHLIGTAFEPDFSGHLLFLEDIGEAPYRIDRMLTQMKMSGKLSSVAGLVLGRFSDCGRTADILGIVEAICGDLGIPILAGIPAGHGLPNMMVPMGAEAELDADAGRISYHGPLFDRSPLGQSSV